MTAAYEERPEQKLSPQQIFAQRYVSSWTRRGVYSEMEGKRIILLI